MVDSTGLMLPVAVVAAGLFCVLRLLQTKDSISRYFQTVLRKHNQNNVIYRSKPQIGFDGLVQFDLGLVGHSTFSKVYIKSEFPRIRPKFEREPVSREDLDSLKSKLMEWNRKHYNVEDKANYFDELSQACVLFSVYVNPFSPLFSQEMDVVIKMYFWLWYADDEIEDAIQRGIPFQSLQQGTDQLRNVLAGHTKFTPVKNNPFFQPLFKSLVDLHKMYGQVIPNYQKNADSMQFFLERYFQAQRWFSVDAIDSRYSEETFRTWRRIIAYFDGIASVTALAEGITLSKDIKTAPSFLRILDIANSFGGFVNDLIGMKKEFKNNQKDNLIVFKVLQKGIPLRVAVEQVCALMQSELEDYLLMKQVVLEEFEYDPNLVKYIDVLESLIDGHNRIYAESTRHCSVGCITLTRN